MVKIATEFLTQRDKQQHIALAAILTMTGLLLGLSVATTLIVTLALGTAKEIWDAFYGTGYSWADQLANLIGSGLGVVAAWIIPYTF
ncbi:MAG: hypothetical protein RBS40_02995 [Rhodocyclaceae bacterium]|nr:hypothetical protein [Rhodocyclaceae bacterium]